MLDCMLECCTRGYARQLSSKLELNSGAVKFISGGYWAMQDVMVCLRGLRRSTKIPSNSTFGLMRRCEAPREPQVGAKFQILQKNRYFTLVQYIGQFLDSKIDVGRS